jgi:hypothetical protein
MSGHSMQAASIPNPALQPFRLLIGTWTTTGTHPLAPGALLHGRASFQWLENGAFLLWRSEIVDDDRFPAGIAILGSDDTAGTFFLLYFDSRGVSRKFDVTLQGRTWKMQRNAPGFSQRFTGVIGADGDSMLGTWELSRDDATWQKDLELTFERLR